MSKQRFLGGLLGANPVRVATTQSAVSDFTTLTEGTQQDLPAGFVIGMTFWWAPDGTSITIGDYTLSGAPVYNYPLPTPWDTSSYVNNTATDVSTGMSYGQGNLVMSHDGLKMWSPNSASPDYWTMTTAYDLHTSTHSSLSLSVSMTSINFNDDGTRVYWNDSAASGTLYQADLSTAYDITDSSRGTATSLSHSSQTGQWLRSIAWYDGGNKLVIMGHSDDTLHMYDCTTAYDITTATFNSSYTFSASDTRAIQYANDRIWTYKHTGTKGWLPTSELTQVSTGTFTDATVTTVTNTFGTDDAAEEVTYYADNLAGANDTGTKWGPGGTTFYWLAGTDFKQVDCSTPYDLTTAGSVSSTTASGGVQPNNMFHFNDDGTQIMYSQNSIHTMRYRPLSTAYDVSTIGAESTVSSIGYYLSAHLGNDGNLYLVSRDNTTSGDGDVRTFSDPSNFAGGLTNQKQLDSGVQYNQTGDVFRSAFNDDGTVMWLALTGDYAGIEELHLSTPYDPTSVTKANNITVPIDTAWTASSGASEIKSLQYANGVLWVMANNGGRKLYKFPISETVSSIADRTTPNVGILSLDEAGPENVTATTSTPDTLDLTNSSGTETTAYNVDGATGTTASYFASTGITSGKHYWEVDYADWLSSSPSRTVALGVYRAATTPTGGASWVNSSSPYYGLYLQDQNYTAPIIGGTLYSNTNTAPYPSLSGGTFGVLLDADNHTITVYIDGVVSADVNGMTTGGSGTETYYPWFGGAGGEDWTHEVNFGQRSFNQTVPAGASAGWLVTSSTTETRELTPFNWGGIRGRSVLGTKASVPSLDLNFDGQASSFTRATTAEDAAKANGDQLATDIISCTRSTTATFMGSNGLIQTAAVNTPRVEFDASGNPLGLLVEESRTNLYPGTTPNNTAAVTFTTNQGTAPDGTNTAIKATENSALGEKNANTSQFSVTSGTQYTASLFAKPAGRTGIRLLLPGAAFGTNHVATYDFQGNGSIIEWSGSSAPEATTITPSGNGWYRISITGTAASTVSTAFIQLVIDDDGTDANTSYQGDGSSGLLIWGIQVEEGAGPTSYIPTTSGSVTRAADDITLATSDFGYLSSTGTSAIDVTVASKTEGNNFPNIFQFQGATDQDRIFLRSNQSAVNGGIVDTQHRDGGTATNTSVLSAPLTWPYTLSFAMAHEGTEMRKALDGTLQAPRTLNQALSNPHSTLGLGISLSSSARVMNGHIRRFTYWPRALSDEQLAAYSGDLDFAGEGLTSTGILSLSELLQASYGLGASDVTGQFMLIGGGGSGSGAAAPGYPGGGGAGGVVYGSSFSFSTGSYAISVGAGGASAGQDTYGNAGSDTTGFGFTATGGGGGAGGGSASGSDARNGGSGAGPNGSSTQDTYSGTANVTGYGNAGGASAGTDLTGGGGGGAGEAGNTDGDGSGGDGLTNSFLDDIQYGELSGGNYYVAGGGAGGKYGGAQVSGGLGGGGDGAVGGTSSGAWVDATAGTDGYGSGGGGGNRAGNVNHYKDGEAGGKGVVLVWLPQSYSLGSDYTGTATTSAKTVDGVSGTLITFTTSGTWTPTF